MKKTVIAILISLLLCFLCACGKDDGANGNKDLPPTEDLIYVPVDGEDGGDKGEETDKDPQDADKPSEEGYYIVNGLETGGAELVIIPESHEGKTVVGIGDNAFKDNATVKEIVIPKTVVTIGENAFSGCTNLTAVYYYGLKTDWDKIKISSGNDALIGKVYYYSATQPQNENYSFWYIKNNKPVVWEATNSNGEYTPYY